MLTIQLGNLLMQPKFLKTETALCGILNISVRTKLIRRLLRPSVFMHLDIVILGQLFHFDLKGQVIEGVAKRGLDVEEAVVDENILEVGLKDDHTAADDQGRNDDADCYEKDFENALELLFLVVNQSDEDLCQLGQFFVVDFIRF